jgi:hypothetical protein
VTLPTGVLLKKAVHRHYAAAPMIGVLEPLLFGDGLGARVDRREVRTLLAEVRDQTPAQKPFHRPARLGVPPVDELRLAGSASSIHRGYALRNRSRRTRIRSGRTYIRGRCLFGVATCPFAQGTSQTHGRPGSARRLCPGDVLVSTGKAGAKAKAFLRSYPKAAYMSEVERCRELPDGAIEFTMRRLRTAD